MADEMVICFGLCVTDCLGWRSMSHVNLPVVVSIPALSIQMVFHSLISCHIVSCKRYAPVQYYVMNYWIGHYPHLRWQLSMSVSYWDPILNFIGSVHTSSSAICMLSKFEWQDIYAILILNQLWGRKAFMFFFHSIDNVAYSIFRSGSNRLPQIRTQYNNRSRQTMEYYILSWTTSVPVKVWSLYSYGMSILRYKCNYGAPYNYVM